MTEYLTEQEQIEILKNWIKQYAVVIIAGVVLSILAITGWRYWQEHQIKTLNRASALYDKMLMNRAQGDVAAMTANANKLHDTYPKTPYGQMASFMLAQTAVVKKDYKDAEKNLNWVLDNSKNAAFKQIARLRLARVMIAENKEEDAIKTLSKVEDKSFNGLIYEVKGDAYLAMKNINSAREAYKQALVELPNAETIRPLLQMKYDNLNQTAS